MKHFPKEIPDELFELIQNKAFHELSPEEKNWVNEFLTEEEYLSASEFVLDFHKLDQSISNDNNDFNPEQPTSKLYRLLHYNIPFYKVAVAALIWGVLSFCFWDIHSSSNKGAEETLPSNAGTSLDKEVYPDSLVFIL